MTVSLNADTIVLSGACNIEEVETLVGYLESRPDLSVDIGAATMIHTAFWQALMVFRPKIIGSAISSLIAKEVLRGLNANLDENQEPQVKLAEVPSSQ